MAGTLWGTIGIYVRRYNEEGLQALDIALYGALNSDAFFLLFI